MTIYQKNAEAIASLSDIQIKVTQENGTEYPGTGEYLYNDDPGLYVDVVSGEPLFLSRDKFDAGCGWPSFAKPIEENALQEVDDFTHGMSRIEVRSKHADSHLGHVFPDGPINLGGLRYCINSAALRFIPKDEMASEGYENYLTLLD